MVPSEIRAEHVQAVYDQLRAIAQRMMGVAPGHTLQPTAIVHEAYLKLASSSAGWCRDETHFLAVAAKIMRQVIVDHHRATCRAKRGGARRGFSLDTTVIGAGVRTSDPIEIDDALVRLAEHHARAAEVVEMRFFGGMTHEQVARRLGVSEPTVRRDWRFARAWLHANLKTGGGLL